MKYPVRTRRIPFGWLVVGFIALLIVYKLITMFFFSGGMGMMGPMGGGGAVPVNVVTLSPKNVQTWQEFSGRTRAVDYAEIRPQVSGRITEIRFKDGDEVKQDDILMVIDPRPFEAALEKAKASFHAATTTASLAGVEAGRAIKMYKNQAITQSMRDQRVNEQRVADAAMLVAKAELQRASVDVEHAYVRAPFAGRVSRAEITVGNLVQAEANPPILTTIVSNKQIYADFELDEASYLNIAAQKNVGGFPIELHLNRAGSPVYKGQMATFDNHIDPSTGTMRARATFDNPDGLLVPGMFVTVRLGTQAIDNALVIPERAIGTDQNKKFVYVVDASNKVLYREVSLGSSTSSGRIVLSGLKAGEKVIVDGVQHVHPDSVVTPTEAGKAQPAPAKK